MSTKDYESYFSYFTLAIMLKNLNDLTSLEDFNEVRKWAKNYKNGWSILFFAADLLLSNEEEFRWEKYGGVIKSMSGEKKNIINELYELFSKKR